MWPRSISRATSSIISGMCSVARGTTSGRSMRSVAMSSSKRADVGGGEGREVLPRLRRELDDPVVHVRDVHDLASRGSPCSAGCGAAGPWPRTSGSCRCGRGRRRSGRRRTCRTSGGCERRERLDASRQRVVEAQRPSASTAPSGRGRSGRRSSRRGRPRRRTASETAPHHGLRASARRPRSASRSRSSPNSPSSGESASVAPSVTIATSSPAAELDLGRRRSATSSSRPSTGPPALRRASRARRAAARTAARGRR